MPISMPMKFTVVSAILSRLYKCSKKGGLVPPFFISLQGIFFPSPSFLLSPRHFLFPFPFLTPLSLLLLFFFFIFGFWFLHRVGFSFRYFCHATKGRRPAATKAKKLARSRFLGFQEKVKVATLYYIVLHYYLFFLKAKKLLAKGKSTPLAPQA